MYQFKGMEDTIVAIATPLGAGGIGIVRLSGKRAITIADELFVAKNRGLPSEFKSFTAHYGWVRKPGEEDVIDEALLTVFRGPKSYTAEDVVEISCHGGHVPLKAVLSSAVEQGARIAEPGEFTKRAFLNGRIDLVKAEAVLDVITAQTDAFLRVSTHQLKGELSSELESIREHLMNVYTEIEAIVNFPEDDIDAAGRRQITERISIEHERVEKLLLSSRNGRILKEGIRVVLCGKPNVGKSSILNALLKQQRAIVTDIAGTTRDVLEESAQIKGIPFVLVDTAGILEPRDLIEEEAIKRSHLYIESADLVLLVLDISRPLSGEDMLLLDKTKDANVLVAFNKSDLDHTMNEAELPQSLGLRKIIKVSAFDKKAIDALESAIVETVWQEGEPGAHGILISNMRHVNALKAAQQSMAAAMEIVDQGIALEFASEEIKNAVNHLDGITGRNIDADLLDRIFSQFCIGK
jgi:tRNA modification GTPase